MTVTTNITCSGVINLTPMIGKKWHYDDDDEVMVSSIKRLLTELERYRIKGAK